VSDAGYISFPLTTDYDTLHADALDFLAANLPGWVPREGQLDTWMVEVWARMQYETQAVAALVPLGIFAYFGKSVLGIPAITAWPAAVQSTWTLTDTNGHTIPAGTVVAYPIDGDTSLYFQVAGDVTVPPSSSTTSAGEVTLIAVEAGTAANGLGAGTVNLVDSLAWVDTITTTATTAGGVDAESDAAYLDRLRTLLKLLAPRPIKPADFSALALEVAGVARATTIDGYNPGDLTSGNERMVAVAVADAAGQPLSSGVKTAVQTFLDSEREVNFVVNVIDPTYTSVNVTATLKKLSTADGAVVQAAAEAALADYLSPANWDWSGTVRRFELVSLLDQVAGVDYVVSITTPSGDVALSGVASLPQPGSITITVT
jgi:uncharacterized phage protein gp47/JayE